ncbi:MAG: hypothetical protein IJJ43_01750 [Oscillospiraceae bacterium]|nr:hypothetical protein [Oscillospiraceae bacterium]
MLKVLLKKQIAEVFRSYFYDAKKNRMRSKWAIAAWIVFFAVVMVGVLGGMFAMLSLSLCGALAGAGMGWLYFLLLCGIAILLGAFGSVFNTYAGLYLAKDNDLLLSMPIPVKTIMAARLLNVYLMGTMYAATVMLPALIVYWVTAGATAGRVICGLLLLLIVTVIVLLLSCLLGWVVARISLKLKSKSFITVLVALVFIAAYYFFYFKANLLIQELIRNAGVYGAKIKGTAYGLYLFGRIGEGDWLATAIFLALTALISLLIWRVMSRSFLKIATSTGNVEKKRYVEKTAKERGAFGALFAKELGRFASSANYMLNTGLGILVLPAIGVLLLVKGRELCAALGEVFAARPGTVAILLCTALCTALSMNDMAAPSVSLEGKSLWIPQSLPVEAKTVLRAKASMQLLLSAVPMLIAAVCTALVVEETLAVRLLLVAAPLTCTVFTALGCTAIGLRMPLLNWTNELAPIKQSGAVLIAIFGLWGLTVVFAGLYLLVGYKLGAAPYLAIWTLAYAAASLLLLRWLDTKGAAAFEAL